MNPINRNSTTVFGFVVSATLVFILTHKLSADKIFKKLLSHVEAFYYSDEIEKKLTKSYN